jgi:hypothetical protein
VEVPYDEGVATRVGPEPCAGACEASAGECTGQPLNRERPLIPGADTVPNVEGHTHGRATRERLDDPSWSQNPGMCRSFPSGNRQIPRPAGGADNARCTGPHRDPTPGET